MMTSSIDRIVGANVYAARCAAGLSREDLAEVSGLKAGLIGRSEVGEHRLTAQELWAVSRALAAPAGVFLQGLVRH